MVSKCGVPATRLKSYRMVSYGERVREVGAHLLLAMFYPMTAGTSSVSDSILRIVLRSLSLRKLW